MIASPPIPPTSAVMRYRLRVVFLACMVAGLTVASLAGPAMSGAMLGCVPLETTRETGTLGQERLTQAEEVQNDVSAVPRAAAGALLFPFELLGDLTDAVGSWFDSEEGRLADLLRSADEYDREEGLNALSRIGSVEAERLLVYHLYADNSVICRREAALGLRRIDAQSPEATYVLTHRALGEEYDLTVQATCTYALSRAGEREQALDTLGPIYSNQENHELLRAQAMLALAERGVQEIRPDCEDILNTPAYHPLWHANALLALANLGGADSRTYLIRGLSHMDDRAVSGAITGLGINGDFSVLLTLCREGTLFQRTHALIALGEYGGSAYVPLLARYRRRLDIAQDPLSFPTMSANTVRQPAVNPNTVIGIYATFALAAAGHRPVVPHLIDLLHPVRHEPWVRLWALHWLIQLTGQALDLETASWQTWWAEDGERFLVEGRDS